MAGPTKLQIRLAQKYGKKKKIPASALLELMENESGFNPAAVSSANAQGLTQFIPGTAQAYDVQYGTSKKAQKTQIRGAARYLNDLGWNTKSPREALAGYYGAASPYADELLTSTDYDKYDKASNQVTGGGGKSSRKLSSATSKEKILTKPAQSFKQERQSASLSFIQEDDKSFSDYAQFADTIKSLKDTKAQYKTKTTKSPTTKAGSGRKGSPQIGKGKSVKDILDAAKIAEGMGLNVGEHPKYGGVAPVHATGSFHYAGRALDVSGDPRLMARFANKMKKRYTSKLAELFWNGQNAANVDNGVAVQKGFVSGHTDHVHIAI